MRNKRIKRRKTNWKKVDWSLSNNEIALKYGVSYHAVYFQRIKRTEYQAGKKRNIDWSLVSKDMSIEQISGILKIDRKTAYQYLFLQGYRVRPKKSDWLAVDWSKSNSQIAEEMSVTSKAVSFQRKKHTDSQPT